MAKVTIYHNPRCQKSCQTLQLLSRHGCDMDVVEYLKDPLTTGQLQQILIKLEMTATQILRIKDLVKFELSMPQTEAECLALLADHPIVMERPIVVSGQQAVLGRPPENVHRLL